MRYRKDIGSLKELIEKANQDSDAASCFVNGEDWEHCDGVVIVVKGRDEAFRAANILANAGMRTAGKPVVDSVSNEKGELPRPGSERGARGKDTNDK